MKVQIPRCSAAYNLIECICRCSLGSKYKLSSLPRVSPCKTKNIAMRKPYVP